EFPLQRKNCICLFFYLSPHTYKKICEVLKQKTKNGNERYDQFIKVIIIFFLCPAQQKTAECKYLFKDLEKVGNNSAKGGKEKKKMKQLKKRNDKKVWKKKEKKEHYYKEKINERKKKEKNKKGKKLFEILIFLFEN
ncbi:hypothetical protein RFI_25049, partial [Reticulomyxa filosa]